MDLKLTFFTFVALAAYVISDSDTCNTTCQGLSHASGYCEPTGSCNQGEVDIGQDGCLAFEACCCITTTTSSTTTTTLTPTTTLPKDQYGCLIEPASCSQTSFRCARESYWDSNLNTCAWNSVMNLCHATNQYFSCQSNNSQCQQGDLDIVCNRKYCDCCDGPLLWTYENQSDIITCTGQCVGDTCALTNNQYGCSAEKICSTTCDSNIDAQCAGKKVNETCGNGGVCSSSCQCECPAGYVDCGGPISDYCFPIDFEGTCNPNSTQLEIALTGWYNDWCRIRNGTNYTIHDLINLQWYTGVCCTDQCCGLGGGDCSDRACFLNAGGMWGGVYTACCKCSISQNTIIGGNTSIQSGQTQTLTTQSGVSSQSMSVTVESRGVSLILSESTANPVGNPTTFTPVGAYFDVTYTGSFNPPIEVCLSAPDNTTAELLGIYHYLNGSWMNETFRVESDTVCSQTTQLSWFVLGLPHPEVIQNLGYGWSLISLPVNL